MYAATITPNGTEFIITVPGTDLNGYVRGEGRNMKWELESGDYDLGPWNYGYAPNMEEIERAIAEYLVRFAQANG